MLHSRYMHHVRTILLWVHFQFLSVALLLLSISFSLSAPTSQLNTAAAPYSGAQLTTLPNCIQLLPETYIDEDFNPNSESPHRAQTTRPSEVLPLVAPDCGPFCKQHWRFLWAEEKGFGDKNKSCVLRKKSQSASNGQLPLYIHLTLMRLWTAREQRLTEGDMALREILRPPTFCLACRRI